MASEIQTLFPPDKPMFTNFDIPKGCCAPVAGTNKTDLLDGSEPGSIHYFFRPEAFIEIGTSTEAKFDFHADPIDSNVYRNGMPAFALATIFLRRGVGFLSALLHAPRSQDHDGNVVITPWLLHDITLPQLFAFDKVLKEIADRTRISIYQPKDSNDITHGTTGPYFMPEMYEPIVYQITCCPVMWQALSDPKWNTRPLHEKCTIWIMLAITLVHEIAHLVWMYANQQDILDDYYADGKISLPDEPKIQPYTDVAELGFAWEQYQFGGAIWQGKALKFVDGKWAYCSVRDGTRGLEISQRRMMGEEKSTNAISTFSTINLMRKSLWYSGHAIQLLLLPLERRQVDTGNEENTDEDVKIKIEDEDDDCEAESDYGDYMRYHMLTSPGSYYPAVTTAPFCWLA